MGASDFETKDSGERAQFASGMQRDTQAGKPRFELMLPLGVPYDEQMIVRLAALYGRGAEKYDERNWEQANSEEEMDRMKASAFRHFMQWLCGETDEDHAAGAMFNIIAFETTAYKVAAAERDSKHVHFAETIEMPLPPELGDLPSFDDENIAPAGCNFEDTYLGCPRTAEDGCSMHKHRQQSPSSFSS